MKTGLKILIAVLCVSAVALLFIKHHPASAAATTRTVQPAPVIIKDHETQLEAVKAMHERFLASGIDATLELNDPQTCAAWLKKMKTIKSSINCDEQPVQLTVKYALANKVFAYQLAHDKDFLETLHLLGFTRVVLVNPVSHKHWAWFGTEKDGFSTEWSEDSY